MLFTSLVVRNCWDLDLFRLMERFLFLSRSSFLHESCSRVMKWLNHGNGSHEQASRCQKEPSSMAWTAPQTKRLENSGWINFYILLISIDMTYIEPQTWDLLPLWHVYIQHVRTFPGLACLHRGLTWAQGPFNQKFVSQSEGWGKLRQGVMSYGRQSKPSCLSALLKGR